ncbi:hypothetical protein A1O3_00548 [Capronia epimyces CBS 606.96]|uniref:Methyltransferase type 11 domain-containing protein n=1 Tax=Capronia epimyces CBS 606.96 TaxID=1182542 RepID=W9YHI0_9EURO|nr:uncharacterized protein A1O3_00548 [Capronia epimyces CBS 606.96]EXJ91998.1 hypothetical protein A1O3_00548 [Capronia epimyces CBS 606.96]
MDSRWSPTRNYVPINPDGPFPYSMADLTPMDAGNDSTFYSVPRFVTHIDENAILSLRKYYDQVLPLKGLILDFCSSWISHYPPDIQDAAAAEALDVVGVGMNGSELSRNPVLKDWAVQDLNEEPEVRLPGSREGKLDVSTCVVSIDYLTRPVEVLESIRRQTKEGGRVHLIISNRCFPTKVVGRWLKTGEEQRLEMVGDYLWWSGWRNIEIQTLVEATWARDPLWVARGENVA